MIFNRSYDVAITIELIFQILQQSFDFNVKNTHNQIRLIIRRLIDVQNCRDFELMQIRNERDEHNQLVEMTCNDHRVLIQLMHVSVIVVKA